MPSKARPRLANRTKAVLEEPAPEAVVIEVVRTLSVASATEVLALLRRRGHKLSRASVFRYLDRAAAAGQLGLLKLGRAKYFHPTAEVAVFEQGPRGLRPVALPPEVGAGLRRAANGGKAFVVLRRT